MLTTDEAAALKNDIITYWKDPSVVFTTPAANIDHYMDRLRAPVDPYVVLGIIDKYTAPEDVQSVPPTFTISHKRIHYGGSLCSGPSFSDLKTGLTIAEVDAFFETLPPTTRGTKWVDGNIFSTKPDSMGCYDSYKVELELKNTSPFKDG